MRGMWWFGSSGPALQLLWVSSCWRGLGGCVVVWECRLHCAWKVSCQLMSRFLDFAAASVGFSRRSMQQG
jgi:hypothetical protein